MRRRWICWPPDSVCVAGRCSLCVPPAAGRSWWGGSAGRRRISLLGLIALPQGYVVPIEDLGASMTACAVTR